MRISANTKTVNSQDRRPTFYDIVTRTEQIENCGQLLFIVNIILSYPRNGLYMNVVFNHFARKNACDCRNLLACTYFLFM